MFNPTHRYIGGDEYVASDFIGTEMEKAEAYYAINGKPNSFYLLADGGGLIIEDACMEVI